MKKEGNEFGILGVIFGILSIIFSSPPLNGIILGILGFIFANKQQKHNPNVWGRRGKVLAVIGILLSVAFFIFLLWLAQNPQYLDQFGADGVQ
jgi:hypothetical protein